MIPTALTSAGLGLASALSYGIADFMGGLASRRANPFSTAIMLNLVGAIAAGLLALLFNDPLPPLDAWLWAAGAGVVGITGLVLLYQAMMIGKMGLAAPVTGVLAAAVPVAFAALNEGFPGIWQIAGFVLALGGVWVVSSSGGRVQFSRGLALAIMAGTCYGAFFILIDQATVTGVFWPLLGAKVSSLVWILIVAAVRSEAYAPPRNLLPLLIAMGLLDVGGNVFFMLAARIDRLDVSAVLASLYPAATVLCARFFLNERLTPLQTSGIVAMMLAIPLIAS